MGRERGWRCGCRWGGVRERGVEGWNGVIRMNICVCCYFSCEMWCHLLSISTGRDVM